MDSYRLYEKLDEKSFDERLINNIPKNSIVLKKDKIVNQFLSYSSLENDLNFIIEAVSALIDFRLTDNKDNTIEKFVDQNLVIKKSLFISIITIYAKCFNQSKKRASLNEDFIRKKFPGNLLNLNDFLDFHTKILNLRNTFIAHSDHNVYENQICFMNFKYNINEGFLHIEINYVSGETYNFDEDDFQLFILICSQLRKNVNEKKAKISDKIISTFSKEQLFQIRLETIKNFR